MALLLRMGGIPARVVTGFSPGGYSKRKQAWIVRDTDAHSWVEAWFDDYGWVTFDPTPAGTPARSQIAAIERPPEESTDRGDAAADGEGGSAPRTGGVRPDLLGPQSGPGGAVRRGRGRRRAGLVVVRACRRSCSRRSAPGWRCACTGAASAPPPRSTARWPSSRPRCGASAARRAPAPRCARSSSASAGRRRPRPTCRRCAPAATRRPRRRPSPGGRRALRRELGSGSGPRGRLRALWALPPWRA